MFLRTRLARALILAIVAARAADSLLLVQDGWCVRFDPARPYVKDSTGAPHAWDLRADWRSRDPVCSAIMTRPYREFAEFPAWFFNLPPDNDSWPEALDRPPEATVTMTVHGFVSTTSQGRLRIEQGPQAPTEIIVDGHQASAEDALAAGIHTVDVRTTLTGTRWRFVPTWDDGEPWSSHALTVARPSRIDTFVRQWLDWVPSALVVSLLLAWTSWAAWRLFDTPAFAWVIGAAAALALLVLRDRADLARTAMIALAAGAFVPVPSRLRNWRGAVLLVGVPWMAFIVASASAAIGRFIIYEWGNDFWSFQRFAYRIVMQGYWLEGGSPTFWFQPLYRWIAGLLHAVFGDSSAGEWYWDGACLLVGATFAWRAVTRTAGFRWGVIAAVLALTTFLWGTAQYLIGRGLGEISSAGLLSAAALWAMRARDTGWRAAFAAGVLGTLGFYARLNNLPMALGTVIFAIDWRRPLRHWREAAIVLGVMAVGVCVFAWRTWHYTGVFSVFYGTQRDLLAIWQPEMSIGTVASRMVSSVLMVLTVNDPPRFDIFALPVLIGAAASVPIALRLWRFRAVPPELAWFFFASIAGAFVARGSAYAGRFSVHVIPVSCALTVSAAAAVAGQIKADVPSSSC
jgi:hypothetical protein